VNSGGNAVGSNLLETLVDDDETNDCVERLMPVPPAFRLCTVNNIQRHRLSHSRFIHACMHRLDLSLVSQSVQQSVCQSIHQSISRSIFQVPLHLLPCGHQRKLTQTVLTDHSCQLTNSKSTLHLCIQQSIHFQFLLRNITFNFGRLYLFTLAYGTLGDFKLLVLFMCNTNFSDRTERTHWVTLSFRNTKVLHQSVTPNLKSDC